MPRATALRLPLPPPPGKTADFYIRTCNEPHDVLAPTVAAAAAISYPHETCVLDDARRPRGVTSR